MKKRHLILFLAAAILIPPLCWAADNLPAVIDPTEVAEDPAFVIQGEYSGEVGDQKIGVQVIALGSGEFEGVLCHGGLPGDGWDGLKPRERMTSKLSDDGSVTFTKDEWIGVLKESKIAVTNANDSSVNYTLKRVERESPTLGAKAPEGAVVLFDGTKETAEKHWQHPKLDGELLSQGALSTDKFQDFTMHIEFLLPWKPAARGQARGNSGLYMTGRYEVQMLDSFGLAGKDNECGGIYKVSEPKQNLCYPPLRWQTYDVDFTGAKFDAEGKKTANAIITVKHNGYPIHENLEIPGPTGGARSQDENGPGPIFLQDHGNPVRYRNIWVVKKN
ncbi:MAG: DUF1080 domain-containing protein [Verrucomicrobiae bacterium]|nr:DUF1080 domain-containing protein [Verrucomicrobiae bacterium]